MTDKLVHQYQAQVQEAYSSETPLSIQGGGSKGFYGRNIQSELLDVSSNSGVISYEPTELVITVRAGTTISEINHVLAGNNQMLAFEPPGFSEKASAGGMIACGLSGPRRPYTGAVRDFVLGVKCLNGKAECLNFGGQVMKNVAGYDVSRLMTGAMGTLGILLEISLKVLPKPAYELTLKGESDFTMAIKLMNQWAGQSIPISAASFYENNIYIRLSGYKKGVIAASNNISLTEYAEGDGYWESVREQTHDYFLGNEKLWRISVPSIITQLDLSGKWLIDWGGALRWLRTSESNEHVRDVVAQVGGHATLFKGGEQDDDIFHPLLPGIQQLHVALKESFDPKRILNRGRLYKEF
ncbi:MAG: glycolate oxidase FAD binding subunit [Gammaproteobacteria bacterium]